MEEDGLQNETNIQNNPPNCSFTKLICTWIRYDILTNIWKNFGYSPHVRDIIGNPHSIRN